MTKVLLAKPGLDGHDKGVKVLATMLRDAGCEVIYTGVQQTPARVALAALQEDVDVVGLSLLSGAHVELSRDVIDELKSVGLAAVTAPVVGATAPGHLSDAVAALQLNLTDEELLTLGAEYRAHDVAGF